MNDHNVLAHISMYGHWGGGQDFSAQVWRGGKNVVRDYWGGGTFLVRAIFGIPPAPPAVNNDHSLKGYQALFQ